MKRRHLLALLPTPALAQRAPRRARLGLLMPYAADDAVLRRRVAGFVEELARLGWQQGRNLTFIEHWTGDGLAAVRLAAEALAREAPDAILTTGSRVVPILQRAASGIPIIFVGISDPAGQGLVDSLARPGRNTTGFSHLELRDGASPQTVKQVEILLDMLPGLARLGLMFNPENPAAAFHRHSFNLACRAMQMGARELPVHGAEEIDRAVAAFAAEGRPGREALVLPSDLTLLGQRAVVVAAMARHAIPAIHADESFVEIGGLASHAADRLDLFRRAGGYADRILRGEAAGELPVQMPTRYALWLNLATARSLGLTLSPSVLARADEVIE